MHNNEEQGDLLQGVNIAYSVLLEQSVYRYVSVDVVCTG